jgi:hypothetical protein
MDDGGNRSKSTARSAPLRIARIGRRGRRGVVAERRTEPGALVERSPVLVIPHADRAADRRSRPGSPSGCSGRGIWTKLLVAGVNPTPPRA